MIAIKEMDMPENCLKCPFIDESGQYCQVDGKALVPNILCIDIEGVRENFKVLESGRHTYCPLIEIKGYEETVKFISYDGAYPNLVEELLF